jgi:hypothetical protein
LSPEGFADEVGERVTRAAIERSRLSKDAHAFGGLL